MEVRVVKLFAPKSGEDSIRFTANGTPTHCKWIVLLAGYVTEEIDKGYGAEVATSGWRNMTKP